MRWWHRSRLLFITNDLMGVRVGDIHTDRDTGQRYRVTKVKPLIGSIHGEIHIWGKPTKRRDL